MERAGTHMAMPGSRGASPASDNVHAPKRLPTSTHYLEPHLNTGAQAILCRSHKVALRAYGAGAPHAHRAA